MNSQNIIKLSSLVTLLFALVGCQLSLEQEQFEQCESNDLIQCQADQTGNVESPDTLGVHKTAHLTSALLEAIGSASDENADTHCLRAAVVEYSRIDLPNDCRISAQKNLEVFDKIARVAHENHVQMLVFPEDGLYIDTRDVMSGCLEEIPDPDSLNEDNSNPCFSQSQSIFKDTPILTQLSCIAKRYGLYLIANFGTKEKCNNRTVTTESGGQNKTICSDDENDFLMLNTNVVLDPEGRFIKRYRKWNPFTETEVFNKAPKLEHTYFDTKFGRFGIFTCFDMIYKEPAIDLVEEYKIDTAIFPTWWFDERPILTGIQYQDGWSSTNKVNLLASNILKPNLGSTGSSIFSTNNSLYVSQNNILRQGAEHKTKLLIANIQTRPRDDTGACGSGFKPKIIDIDDNPTGDNYKSGHYRLVDSDSLVQLDKLQDEKTLCSGGFCCTIDYKLANDTPLDQINRLIFIVRNGPRPGRFQWFEQVCALATLDEPVTDTRLLTEHVKYDSDNGFEFTSLSIDAKFETKYVYPSTAHDGVTLIERKNRNLVCDEIKPNETKAFQCKLKYVQADGDEVKRPARIYSFSMYGRVYEKDKKFN